MVAAKSANTDPDAEPQLVAELARLFTATAQRLVTAESCTGGLLAAACTARAGSSHWFERGYVTYSNAAKQADLGVTAKLLQTHGAVSAPVVAAMTEGALQASSADWAVAISGVAGPGGGSPQKPVGTVFIGWQQRGSEAGVSHFQFDGDRQAVRQASLIQALAGLQDRLTDGS